MRLSVVVVNWNSRADLAACLRSLRDQTHRDLETLVVDNGSTDGSAEMVAREYPECVLLPQTDNLGFAEACNVGIEQSSGPWVAMLNNDAVAEPGWAAALVAAAEQAPSRCGMLQSLMLLLDRPDTVNSTGIELTRSGGGRDRDEGKPKPGAAVIEEIFCPTAGAAAYRREMLDATRLSVGYFDRDHFCYYEDMDLGWRARLAGWSALFVPLSIVHHRWHGSSERHGRSWLVVTPCTNRIRTLVKNASWRFLLATAPFTVRDAARVVWHGRTKAAAGLVQAIRESATQRVRVARLATRPRAEIEQAWVRA